MGTLTTYKENRVIEKPRKTNLTTLIDISYYEYLRNLSFKMSVEENKKIGIGEIVRRALEEKYPHDICLESEVSH